MNNEYITVEEAADILRVSTRQVHRYGEGEDARLRTHKAGRRKMFHKGDVETLASELGTEYKPPPEPKTELLPPSELLNYLRERDQQVTDLQGQLNRAMLEVGRLQGQLEMTQRQLETAHEQIRQLQGQAPPQPQPEPKPEPEKPWWARWLLRRGR